MSETDFFSDLKPWSKRKHRLLQKYMKPFTAKVASITNDRRIFCVDGFAGAAFYGDGSPGSPILLAELSDECSRWANPVSLKMINVEKNKKNFDLLQSATHNWIKRGVVRNINLAFDEATDEILKSINSAPTFFFIDPTGPTKVKFSTLKRLLFRPNAVTEFFLNFDTDGLNRIAAAGLALSDDPKIQKSADSNLKNVEDILGCDTWREKYADADSTSEKEALLLSFYTVQLLTLTYRVVSYPIREALNSPVKYHMIYGTRHDDGVILMNNFVFEEDNAMDEEFESENFPLFASPETTTSTRRIYLKSLITDYLKERKSTTRKQIKRDIIFQRFGLFHEKDFNAVISELVESNVLRAAHGRKRINDSEPLTYTV